MSNLLGDKGPICPNCEGLGIVEDPHHGHAFNCSYCGGTGILKEKK